MRRLLALALIVSAAGAPLLAGCSPPVPPAAPEVRRTLIVTPRVVDAERRVQATVAPYTRSDVARVEIKLYRRVDATETELAARTLLASELDRGVTFENLRPFTSYRVRAFAFQADGTFISEDDASFVDLTLGDDDAPALATLRVQLLDKPFNGQASSAPVAVSDGGLVPAGVETISQPVN